MKNYTEFINEELGEKLVSPYSYRQGTDDKLATYYYFDTEDGDKYTVRFYHMGEFQHKEKWIGHYNVEFVTFVDNYTDGDSIVVNKGRFFKVMSTVITVIKEFVKEKDPKVLKFNPVSNFKKDKRRKNIYIRYIEKMLPNDYKYKKAFFGDALIITKKD